MAAVGTGGSSGFWKVVRFGISVRLHISSSVGSVLFDFCTFDLGSTGMETKKVECKFVQF